jgi:hypothetical protein
MKYRALFSVAVVAVLGAGATPTQAEPRLKTLFEIAVDIDNDGKDDRAALVALEGTGFSFTEKDWIKIGREEHADLYIYLGAGDAPLDLSRQPSFLKRDIVVGERQNQIFPLESQKGSLVVKTAYNLFSNWMPETLTIVSRKGDFLVTGFSRSYDLKSGEQGECEINFLTGRAVASKGVDGKKKAVKGTFRPVRLAEWSAEPYVKACAAP